MTLLFISAVKHEFFPFYEVYILPRFLKAMLSKGPRFLIIDYWYIFCQHLRKDNPSICVKVRWNYSWDPVHYIFPSKPTQIYQNQTCIPSLFFPVSSKQWCGGRSLTVTNWQSMRTFESSSTVVTKTWQTQGYYHRFYYSDIKLITAIPCRLIIGWLRNSILYCISSFVLVAHLTSQ